MKLQEGVTIIAIILELIYSIILITSTIHIDKKKDEYKEHIEENSPPKTSVKNSNHSDFPYIIYESQYLCEMGKFGAAEATAFANPFEIREELDNYGYIWLSYFYTSYAIMYSLQLLIGTQFITQTIEIKNEEHSLSKMRFLFDYLNFSIPFRLHMTLLSSHLHSLFIAFKFSICITSNNPNKLDFVFKVLHRVNLEFWFGILVFMGIILTILSARASLKRAEDAGSEFCKLWIFFAPKFLLPVIYIFLLVEYGIRLRTWSELAANYPDYSNNLMSSLIYTYYIILVGNLLWNLVFNYYILPNARDVRTTTPSTQNIHNTHNIQEPYNPQILVTVNAPPLTYRDLSHFGSRVPQRGTNYEGERGFRVYEENTMGNIGNMGTTLNIENTSNIENTRNTRNTRNIINSPPEGRNPRYLLPPLHPMYIMNDTHNNYPNPPEYSINIENPGYGPGRVTMLDDADLHQAIYITIRDSRMNRGYSPPAVDRGLHSRDIYTNYNRDYNSRIHDRGFGVPNRGTCTCTCAICLEEINTPGHSAVLDTCAHVFHVICIRMWRQHKNTCPICRTPFSLV